MNGAREDSHAWEASSMSIDVQLRTVVQDDLPVFFEQQLDPEATQMAAFPSRDQEHFMAHWAKILADESNLIRTILFAGTVAGNVVCFKQSDKTLIGYWLGREYWGKGIATGAVAQFLRLVEERPLFAFVAKHNIGSIRVLEKCGFVLDQALAPSNQAPGEVEELLFRLEEVRR